MLLVVIALVYAFLKIAHVVILALQTKPGQIFLGTGQYYLDYYYYVQLISQGTWGDLFPTHYHSTDTVAIIWYRQIYVILGWLASIIKISPFAMYWFAIFAGNFAIVGCYYFIINKIIPQRQKYVKITALVISLFATPFYHILDLLKLNLGIYLNWYFPDTFASRPFSVPHHVITQIILLLLIITSGFLFNSIDNFSRKKVLKLVSILIFLVWTLSLIYPFYVVLFFPTFLLSAFIVMISKIISSLPNKKKWFLRFFSSIVFFLLFSLTGAYLIKLAIIPESATESLRSIEGAHHNISFKNMLLNIGPLIIFLPFGFIPFLKKMNTFKIILISFVIISYSFFFSNIDQIIGSHNSRFLSQISYIVFGAVAALGINTLSLIFRNAKKYVFILVSTVLFISFIPPSIRVLINTVNDRNINSPISYFPEGIIEGWMLLGQTKNDKVVLTPPSQFLGQIVPIFVKKKVYISRHNETHDYLNKNLIVGRFYRGEMSTKEAKDFLKQNNIGYVLFTSIEGYIKTPLAQYKFFKGMFANYASILKEVYRNEDIVIFTVKESFK